MENCCLFVNHLSTWGRRPGEGKRDLENNVGLAYVFIYKLKPIAPATRDTQAYVNILFPSYYFVFFFFWLLVVSALLFAIFKVPRISWGWGGTRMQRKCPMGSSKITNLLFGEANLLYSTIKAFSCSFYVTSNTPRQNLSFGWSDPFGTG